MFIDPRCTRCGGTIINDRVDGPKCLCCGRSPGEAERPLPVHPHPAARTLKLQKWERKFFSTR